MEKWHQYPMGPTVQRFLGFQAAEIPNDSSDQPDDSIRISFQNDLITFLSKNKTTSDEESLELLSELVAMGLGEAALYLMENNPVELAKQDFRYLLNIGSALMLTDNYPSALDYFVKAQAEVPEEIATYVNIAAIHYTLQQDEDVETWAKAGLRLDNSHQKLWEYLASVYLHENRQTAGAKIKDFALELGSHCGLSLTASMIAPEDQLYKAELLSEPFENGSRDETYLIEYSAALGLAKQYEKIPRLLWQLEQVDGKKPSWQLLTHTAQAYFGLGKESEAKTIISRLEKNPETPQNIVADLKATFDQHFS